MSFYDNDYNRKLSDSLNQINYALSKKDNLTNVVSSRMYGGARQTDYIQDLQTYGNNNYVKTGTSASYPFLNRNELNQLDGSKVNYLPYQVKTGKGKMTGGFSWSDVGNFLKPIASTALDALVPVASAYTGMPTAVSAVRGAIKGATGVGLKRGRKGGAKTAGVGNYKGGRKPKMTPEEKMFKLEAIQQKKDSKKAEREAKKQAKLEAKSSKPKRVASAGAKKRAEIVKKVMKDMNMKMIDASKYVKDKGLYKK